ncbi:MAG: hypothetical protein FWG50_06555 [Kiritimatiellaeota bacterium]|nr:hypothetical protein [Kiritimatiellota bacterium]
MNKVMRMILGVAMAGLAHGVSSGATWYVSPCGEDGNAGTCWAVAKQTIQAAIDVSAAGDTITVTNGVYAPISTDNKAITIQSVNGAEHTIIDGGGMHTPTAAGNEVITIGPHRPPPPRGRCATLDIGSLLDGFTLTNGEADYGGGAYGGTLNNCVLTGNAANHYGGGAAECTLNNCTLSGNSAFYGGGAGGGELNNCTLAGNTSDRFGGGAYYSTLNNCTLVGNTADPFGGGAYSSTLNNCTLSGNSASYGGGADNSTLNNCTLSGNSASYGGGSCGGTLNNCIVWGNTCSEHPYYNNYNGGTINYSCTLPLPMSGTKNTFKNPQFVDAANGDFRLRNTSPCINAGNNDYAGWGFDLDGNPRIQDGTVDMGAYESPLAPSISPPYLLGFDTDGFENRPSQTIAYDGFVYDDDNTVRGTVTLKATLREIKDRHGTVSTSQTVSVKVILQNATISFAGRRRGELKEELKRFTASTKNNAEALDVFMQGDCFFGTLSGDRTGGMLYVDGARTVFANKKDRAAQDRLNEFRGLYNIALLGRNTSLSRLPEDIGSGFGPPALPIGHLSLSVGNLGSAKIAGVLSDGTKISGNSKLIDFRNSDGWLCVALYKPLYSKKGFIGALLWLNPVDKVIRVDTEYGWSVDWMCNDPNKKIFWHKLDVAGGWFSNGRDAPPPSPRLRFGADVPSDLPPPVADLSDAWWVNLWVNWAFPQGIPVITSDLKLSLPKAVAPKKYGKGLGAYYDYGIGNSSCATLSYTAKTGVFKGTFNLYYDGLDARGNLQHKVTRVPYTGLMIPTRDDAFENQPIGLGIGTPTINKEKIGIPVYLWEWSDWLPPDGVISVSGY